MIFDESRVGFLAVPRGEELEKKKKVAFKLNGGSKSSFERMPARLVCPFQQAKRKWIYFRMNELL
jgi:hypothetical protein